MKLRAACLSFSLVCAWAWAGTPIEPYGRLPTLDDVELSPDGTKLAFTHTDAQLHILVIAAIDDGKPLGTLRLGDTKLRAVEWADDDHLLLTTASTEMPMELFGARQEWHLMQVYDLKAHASRGLLNRVSSDDHLTMNVVYGEPVIRHSGHDTLVYLQGIYLRDDTEAALFVVNLMNGHEKMIREAGTATQSWMLDDDGAIVAEQDYEEAKRTWSIRLFRNGHPQQTVSGVAPIDYPEMVGLTATGDGVIVALTGADGVHWKPLMVDGAVWGPDFAPNERLTTTLTDVGSQRAIGVGYVGDETHYRFFDAATEAGWQWIERLFYKQRVEFKGLSADHTRFLVQVMGPKSGYAYYFADAKDHIAREVGKIYGDVTTIAEVRRIDYSATDGLTIPAYLTLPPGREPKNLPVIVMPHGGPEARDTLGFDWWAQALASQGYAVLQPNYRGSSLDRKFTEAGFGEWGRKMQTDLSDGLHYLATQGIVDPQRACIVGASYGGYAALAGVALQPDVYRCAVAVAGVSDPGTMLKWVSAQTAYGEKTSLRYWNRFLGVEGANDPKLDVISPLKQAAQIQGPVLLIHGREDTIVPFAQSEAMGKALKRYGKRFEFVALDHEDHYLSNSETRLQMLRESVAFLQKYNPAD